MARKRAQILPRSDIERDARQPVVIEGTCRIGERAPDDVLVIDLGLSGCCLRGNWLGMTKSAPLTLHIADVGPLAARIKWARKGSLGVAFDEPLEPALLKKLCDSAPAPETVVPLRRRSVTTPF